jgi:hypothetical protein
MSEIIDVPVGGGWVDIYTATGIEVGKALVVMVDGIYGVRLCESATEPADGASSIALTDLGFGYAKHEVSIGSVGVWVKCSSSKETKVSVQEIVGVDATVRSYDELTLPRQLVTTLTQAEIATVQGSLFDAQVEITLGNGGTEYLQFTMPPAESGLNVGFVSRVITSSDAIDYEVYWEPAGVVKGANIPIFNENQISTNTSLMDYTYVVSVTDEGTLRELEFSTGGQGNAIPSEISPSTGFRIYAPDSVALIKITNTTTSNNRILLTYSWMEISEGVAY